MKNLLNNISSDEKQRILEQHSGGKLIDTRNFRRLLESKLGDVKPLIVEQEVKQGTGGDPYQYKKEGGKYFYAKKSEGTNAKWVEQTKDEGIKAIQTKIFGETPGTNQPITKPLDQKTPTNTTTNTNTNTQTTLPTNTTTNTTAPTNTNQSATNNQQSTVRWDDKPIVGGTFAADKCNGSNTIDNQQVKGFLSDGVRYRNIFWSKSTIDTKNKTYNFYYQEPIKKNSSSGKKYCKITDIKTYDLTGYTYERDNTKTNTKYFGYLVTSVEIPQTT